MQNKEWYVVQTNPREESIAVSILKQKGIGVYQPFMHKYVFHARKKILKKYPLFPNYIFVNLDSTQENIHQLKWSRGIRRILVDNNNPVPVSEEIIFWLHSLEDKSDGIIKKPMEYKSGELIKVKTGPMKDVYGVFDSWDSDEGRVRILIDMVNTHAKGVMHSSMIEKA